MSGSATAMPRRIAVCSSCQLPVQLLPSGTCSRMGWPSPPAPPPFPYEWGPSAVKGGRAGKYDAKGRVLSEAQADALMRKFELERREERAARTAPHAQRVPACVAARRLYYDALLDQMHAATPLPRETWMHIFSLLGRDPSEPSDAVDMALLIMPRQKAYFGAFLPPIAAPVAPMSASFHSQTYLLLPDSQAPPSDSTSSSTSMQLNLESSDHPKDDAKLDFSANHRGKRHLDVFQSHPGFCQWAVRQVHSGKALSSSLTEFAQYVEEKAQRFSQYPRQKHMEKSPERRCKRRREEKEFTDAVKRRKSAHAAAANSSGHGASTVNEATATHGPSGKRKETAKSGLQVEIRCRACIVANGGCERCVQWECNECSQDSTIPVQFEFDHHTNDSVRKDEYGRRRSYPFQQLKPRECMCCQKTVCGDCSDACMGDEEDSADACQTVLCNTGPTGAPCSEQFEYKFKSTGCPSCRATIDNGDEHHRGPDSSDWLCRNCYPDGAVCWCGEPSVYSHFDAAPRRYDEEESSGELNNDDDNGEVAHYHEA